MDKYYYLLDATKGYDIYYYLFLVMFDLSRKMNFMDGERCFYPDKWCILLLIFNYLSLLMVDKINAFKICFRDGTIEL